MFAQKFTYIDNDSKEIECNIISMFNDKKNHFIAYTNGEKTNGLLDIKVSKYEIKESQINLIPIEDDREWNYAQNYLQKNVFGDDNDEK